MSTSNEIILKGDYNRYEEAKIAAGVTTIKPGMLVELNSSGEAILPTAAGKDTPLRIALIDSLQGNIKTTTYTAGEILRYYIPRPGDLVNLFCLSGETINIGTMVIAATSGKGIATTGSPVKTVGQSEEAGGTLGADTHVAVRIG